MLSLDYLDSLFARFSIYCRKMSRFIFELCLKRLPWHSWGCPCRGCACNHADYHFPSLITVSVFSPFFLSILFFIHEKLRTFYWNAQWISWLCQLYILRESLVSSGFLNYCRKENLRLLLIYSVWVWKKSINCADYNAWVEYLSSKFYV